MSMLWWTVGFKRNVIILSFFVVVVVLILVAVNRSLNRNSIYRLKHAVYYGVENELKFIENDCNWDRGRLQKLFPIFSKLIDEERSKDEATFVDADEYFVCDG